MFLLNKTFVEKLDKHIRSFFWACKKKKNHMVKWSRICRSKSKGGLGVKDPRKQNISLLCKWWWKLETQNGLWQQIVKAKYLRNKTVASVKPCVHDSPGWKTLYVKSERVLFCGRKLVLSKQDLVRFWIDPWLDNKPLSETCPALFAICHGQYWTFEKVLSCDFDVPFRRRLLPAVGFYQIQGTVSPYVECLGCSHLELEC
jgi:hypothetical protein